MTPWLTSAFSRRYLLPTLLLTATILILGCYFETNDDIFIVFLLRGVGTLQPVANLHLYFHGLSAGLAWLYGAIPSLPWYGLLLYSLLLVSFWMLFSVFDQVMAAWSPRVRVALLVVLFIAGGLESVLRMNFTRVPVMLSGATVLYSLLQLRTRPGFNWRWLTGAGLMLLAWAIRPSGAFLGLAAVAPALLWLAPRRPALLIVGLYTGVMLAASGSLMLNFTTAEKHYQKIDILKANLKDYNLYLMHPASQRDSVALESLDRWWGLGDTTLVNNAFFQRTATFSPSHSLRDVLLPKVASLLGRFAGDYFLVVFVNLALLWVYWQQPASRTRHWAWLYTLYIGVILAGLGIVLQLPARLATPLLCLTTVVNGTLIFPQLTRWPFASRRAGLAVLALFGLLLGGYMVKNGLRARRHWVEREKCEAYLAQVAAYVGNRPSVQASLFLRSLSPLRNYNVSNGPILTINGWTAHDHSQSDVMQQLTGTRSFRLAMERLAARPDVVWLLPEGFGPFFTRYLGVEQSPAPAFCPAGPELPKVNDDLPMPRFYKVCNAPATRQP